MHNNPTWHELAITRYNDWDATHLQSKLLDESVWTKGPRKLSMKFKSLLDRTLIFSQLWALHYYCGKTDNEEVVFRRRKSGRCNWPNRSKLSSCESQILHLVPNCEAWSLAVFTWQDPPYFPILTDLMIGTSHLQGLQGRWLHIRAYGEQPRKLKLGRTSRVQKSWKKSFQPEKSSPNCWNPCCNLNHSTVMSSYELIFQFVDPEV